MSSDEPSDAELRKQIRDALVKHATEVGLGLRCATCGQEVAGGDWQQQIRDAFDPNKNGFHASLADTKAKFEDAGRKIKHEFENPNSDLAKFGRKVANELGNENSHLRRGLKGFVSGVNQAKEVVGAVNVLRGKGLDGPEGPTRPVQEVSIPVVKKRKWSEEAKARAKARAQDKNSHANKVKAYMKKHGVSLAEASKAVKGS